MNKEWSLALLIRYFSNGITMEPLQKQKEPRSHQRSKPVLSVIPFDLRNLW